MAMDAARSWHWMGELQEDLARSYGDCLRYDDRAVTAGGPGCASAAGPAGPGSGERVATSRGMPPALVPSFVDVRNSGSPRPGTWIYLSEAIACSGPVLPVLRMVYWDGETGTWRRFMATPDCIEPVTVPMPWDGARQPPTDARDGWRVRGCAPPGQGPPPRRNLRPEYVEPRRGPDFVRSTRLSIPNHDARVARLAVQAFSCLMVGRSSTSGHHPPPSLEEIALAVATLVHEDDAESCGSSSVSEVRTTESSANERRGSGDGGYGPVRTGDPSATRRGPAGPRPVAKRLPRWWRYTDIID